MDDKSVDNDVMPPVIIPAQPGWYAKRRDDGSQYQPVIAWVILSIEYVGDFTEAIGAISGRLETGWRLEYNPMPKPWSES